ncbi:MAG: autotransporter-associated beta strand repeat-containing protein [Thermoguttaceae bacterium]
MSVRRVWLVCVIMVAGSLLVADGADAGYFVGAGGVSLDYATAHNWSDGVVPGSSGAAFIGGGGYSGGTATLNSNALGYGVPLNMELGFGPGTSGTLDLQGSGAALTVAQLFAGYANYSSGTLRLEAGTFTVQDQAVFSWGTSATSAMNISGGTLNLGAGTSGNRNTWLGYLAGSTTTATQSGGVVNGGTAGIFAVGMHGAADYTISGGSLSLPSHFNVGLDAGSTGTFTQNGGVVSNGSYGNTYIGNLGTGTYHINTGSLSVYNSLYIGTGGGAGSFIQDGGVVQQGPNAAGTLAIGKGSYALNGGTLTLTGLLDIGVTAGATGSVNQTAGLIQTGGSADAVIGRTGVGVYTISGGTIELNGSTYVGYADGGNGAIRQTGGVVQANGALQIGDGAGATGAYTLEAGAFSSTTGVVVGHSGVGSFDQNGGTASVAGNVSGVGAYNLAGGTMNMNGQNVSVATFKFTGGTLQNVGAVSTNAHVGASPVFQQDAGVGVISGGISDVDGAVGTLTKTGAGVLIVSGSCSYTGKTTVTAGTLQMALPGYSNLLSHTADIQGGQMVFDYTNVTTPAKAIRTNLHSGAMYTSTGAAAGYVVGYNDDGTSKVTAKVALLGDTDLGGTVNNDDLARLLSALGRADCFWQQGDFNYDAKVNNDDLAMLLSNLGKRFAGFGGAKAQAVGGAVPEPSTLVLLTAGLAGLLAYAWRKRKLLRSTV